VNFITYGNFLDALGIFKLRLEKCLSLHLQKWCPGHSEDYYQINLPALVDWGVKRLDVSINFILDSDDVVQEFLHHLWVKEYPRRKVRNYGSTLYFAGYSSTLKLYNKYQEFCKHDRADWIRYFRKHYKFPPSLMLNCLAESCLGVLRLELELKQRLLYLLKKNEPMIYESGKKCYTIKDIFINNKINLEQEISASVRKMFMNTEQAAVSKNNEVLQRLRNMHGVRNADNLYAFWVQVVTLGEKIAKKDRPKRTYYKYKKLLKEAGISLVSTDLETVDIKTKYPWPEDFDICNISADNKYIQKSMTVSEAMDFVSSVIKRRDSKVKDVSCK
jgi:II/X family phage/plasmid replication protein